MRGARDSGKSGAGSHVLTELAADLIAIIDSQGHLRYVNPSVTRILGYARDQLLGRTLQDLVHPEDVDTLRAALDSGRALRLCCSWKTTSRCGGPGPRRSRNSAIRC